MRRRDNQERGQSGNGTIRERDSQEAAQSQGRALERVFKVAAAPIALLPPALSPTLSPTRQAVAAAVIAGDCG